MSRGAIRSDRGDDGGTVKAMGAVSGKAAIGGGDDGGDEAARAQEGGHNWIGRDGGAEDDRAGGAEAGQPRREMDRGAEVVEMIVERGDHRGASMDPDPERQIARRF